jgi:hypothetical protein
LDGISSTITGLETPDIIDLRKRAGNETPDPTSYASKELYRVIQEKKSGTAGDSGQLFGSERTYVLPSIDGAGDEQQSVDEDLLSGTVTGEESKSKRKRKPTETSSAAAKKYKDFKF